MNDLFPFDPDKRENFRVKLLCHVWLLIEAIHYSRENLKENVKITLGALQWFSDGLYPLTLEEILTLYFLLSPTEKTKRLSSKDTKILALLSKLCDINSENNFGTSQFQNFKSVEPFISMLCSGVFPIPYINPKDIPDWLPLFGGKDMSS